jgi:hypothetical protein
MEHQLNLASGTESRGFTVGYHYSFSAAHDGADLALRVSLTNWKVPHQEDSHTSYKPGALSSYLFSTRLLGGENV